MEAEYFSETLIFTSNTTTRATRVHGRLISGGMGRTILTNFIELSPS
jgi:hypothetical protein